MQVRLKYIPQDVDFEGEPFLSDAFPTFLQALADIESKLEANFFEDSAIVFSELVESCLTTKSYERRCFSTPELNFTLEVVHV